jgi:hypothetical protein
MQDLEMLGSIPGRQHAPNEDFLANFEGPARIGINPDAFRFSGISNPQTGSKKIFVPGCLGNQRLVARI